jgi:hypothetical protein
MHVAGALTGMILMVLSTASWRVLRAGRSSPRPEETPA